MNDTKPLDTSADHASHAHDHAHHHEISSNADARYLTVALLLLVGFMLVEVVVGILSSSLALLSDAGHMLTDAGAIGLSLVVMRLSRRPASGRYTFGFKRAEILSAQANGITLLLLAGWFAIEAITRLVHPPMVHGIPVTLVALAGVVVNLAVVAIMNKANRQSMNVEGSFQHILTDLYAFIATAIAGLVVWWTGWNRVDALAALLIAGLMFKAGYALVRDSGRVFLEAAPRNLDPQAISKAICGMAGVTGLRDLHVWEVTSGFPALAAHVFVRNEDDCHDKRREIEAMLQQAYDIAHTTLQMDHAGHGEVGRGCQHV
jgi:cobalt-zinc-cadmium efflux system protein